MQALEKEKQSERILSPLVAIMLGADYTLPELTRHIQREGCRHAWKAMHNTGTLDSKQMTVIMELMN